MSNAFRELAKQRQQEPERDLSRCFADGCPCRGSMSLEGGRWTCTAHAFAPSEGWPRITAKLRDHAWLLAFMDDIQRMDKATDLKAWRAFATQFWAGQDDFCIPHEREEAGPYVYRMRGELLYRCGLSRRPVPRIPEPVKSRGNASRFAWRQA